MINIAQDSDATTFQLWRQNQMNSCGVASVWMARGIVRQMSFAEDEWDLAQRTYRAAVNNALAPLGVNPSGPMTLDPRAFGNNQKSMANTLANFGFYGSQLAAAIRAEGLNVTHVGFTGRTRVLSPHLIGDGKAAIALVAWNGGGGHFVVAARAASNGEIVFLDPWDGQINELANTGGYVARYGGSGNVVEVIYIS